MTEQSTRPTRPLTPRQRVFVSEYLIDLNATAAYVRAGYSANGARHSASRLLANDNVRRAVDEAMVERAERLEIDADDVLLGLAAMHDADLADLFDADGAVLPMHEWPEVWRKGLVAGVEVEERYATVGGEQVSAGRVVRLRLADRLRVLDLIGRHTGVNAWARGGNGSGCHADARCRDLSMLQEIMDGARVIEPG